MGRPQPNDAQAGAGPEPAYLPPDAQQGVAATAPPGPYPPPMSPPVNPVVSGYDAPQSAPAVPGAATVGYQTGPPEPAPYPPPSPYPPPEKYPPPEQYPPLTVQPLQEGYPPVAGQPIGEPWSTGLFDCHEHQTNAIMTAFFPCVTFGQIAEILDAGQTSCTMGSLMYLLMAPALCTCFILGSSYRAKLRQRYNLVQAPAEDWVLHLACPCCALCQEFRELRNKGIDPALGYLGNLAQQQAGTATIPPHTQFMNP